MKERIFTGTTSNDVQDFEKVGSKVSMDSATEGFVLLKNEGNLLPLDKNQPVSLYGSGSVFTVKGGTGSGDVNVRKTVSIYEGLKNHGFSIKSEKWIKSYRSIYTKAREDWRDELWRRLDNPTEEDKFYIYAKFPFTIPEGDVPSEKTDARTGIFVLSRQEGEGQDTFEEKGHYYLSEREDEILSFISKNYEHVVVLINTGSVIDLSFIDKYKNIDSVLLVSGPGQEGGNAVAKVISGEITPSGKLTDTWAKDYKDYPNSKTFSHNNGNTDTEVYEEGIYVGYRYFDTFQIEPRYCFGYGLSYTTFNSKLIKASLINEANSKSKVELQVEVTNTGNVDGKEVVQIYASCPISNKQKEYRRLVGFDKTSLLKPTESEVVSITIDTSTLETFSESESAWLLEKGSYVLFVGNNLNSSKAEVVLNIDKTVVIEKVQSVCPLKTEINELELPISKLEERRNRLLTRVSNLIQLKLSTAYFTTRVVKYGDEKISSEIMDFVDKLSEEQLIKLSCGEMGDSSDNFGSSGDRVPGAAAQTSNCAQNDGLPVISLADGPAGLRLTKNYSVKNNEVQLSSFETNLENGYLSREKLDGTIYHQYCTAFPIGTLLAQTWNKKLIYKVGETVANEMRHFNVTLWLAPGMNIHRNPLCGRNFEYYSEDPFISGVIAAYMTLGVQSIEGNGTTIKHLALNNQEDNRVKSDSVVGERTLREIYLKGFEIATKMSNPYSIMTSYNLINGIHAANNFDLCTKVVRDEWEYSNLIMTDWNTTQNGRNCTASKCIAAGNDVIMPGSKRDTDDIKRALDNGDISLSQLKKCIAHLITVIQFDKERYLELNS
ncbi:MAG: glycoside hydrolase family 3 protein [Pleomorphochaeta sp.]